MPASQAGIPPLPSPAAPADRPPHGRRILLVSYYPPTRRHAGGLRLLDLCSLIRKLEPALRVDLVTCTDSMADPLTEGDRRVFDQVFLLPVKHFTARGLAAAGVLDTAYDVADFQYRHNAEDAYEDVSQITITTSTGVHLDTATGNHWLINITPGTACFLVICLNGVGQIDMYHRSNVGFVNAHSKGICTTNHSCFIQYPIFLPF